MSTTSQFRIVNTVVCFVDRPVNLYDYLMYHGEAKREGDGPNDDTYHFFGDGAPRRPLLITCNAFLMPQLMRPEFSFVVSEHLQQRMSQWKHIEFLRVRFKKVFSMRWQIGDGVSSLGRIKVTPEGLFRKQKHVPDLAKKLPPYYEVIFPRHMDLEHIWKDMPVFEMRDIRDSVFNEPMDIRISPSLLAEYPIMGTPRGWVLSEEAFKVLSPHLPKEFFSVTVAKMP